MQRRQQKPVGSDKGIVQAVSLETAVPIASGSGAQNPDSKDAGDLIATQLEDFKRPLAQLPARRFLSLGSLLVLESLVTGSQMVGTFVVNAAGHILLNSHGTTADQAAMGLALAYHLWFYYGMLIAIYEKFGIDWSRSFGAKQYHLTRTYLYQAAILQLFREEILTVVGTVPEQAAAAARVLKLFLVATVIASAEELLKNFSMAQGHEAVFGKTILFSIIPALAAAYWFIAHAGYGVAGWVYSKILYEAINLLTSAVVLFLKTHPETWGRISLTPVLNGLGEYSHI